LIVSLKKFCNYSLEVPNHVGAKGRLPPGNLRLRETSEAHSKSCSGTIWLKVLLARLRLARPRRQSAEALMSATATIQGWHRFFFGGGELAKTIGR
jgi:hypothetical protein